MEVNLSEENLKELAVLIAPLIKPEGQRDWVKLAEVRDDLFAGKAPAWIRLHVFDAFPAVQIENNPQGWVKGVHGKGNVTRIYLPTAREWLRKHHDEINWNEKI
ncbi:hypothetical protein [Limosilactobacillus fermentum]|uniref:hypothetical protein n=1 Tax=Limosilactobacillus fermentum TaxID=1613 RepID=UPI001C0DEF61|nr:hypothetical protein [Limosilactobacillus fermentum]QWS01527.1 hypothetical protein I6U31_07050 [Limosilactobacillus fermentum]UJP16544.1 hypothetical protein L1970_04635 [Limosilactobacillus fermentum]